MDNGVILAELNSMKNEFQQVQNYDINPLDGERQYLEDPVTPPIGGDETKKPFDIERDEDGVLRMVRNVFMSSGELYELADKEVPEGTTWIWLKTVIETMVDDGEKDHNEKLQHSIVFEKPEEAKPNETWKPIYKLTDELEIEIDFRACLYETGLTIRELKCIKPVIHSPDDPSLNETLYPKYHIMACNDIELSWATLMKGSDGNYYIFQNGEYIRISNAEEDGSEGGGSTGGDDEDSGTGISGTFVFATVPRYDEASHRLLYTPVSLTFANGRLTAMETGAESVIAQAVEESA